MKALSPAEVKKQQVADIPDFVIEAVNQMLLKKFDGRKAIIRQPDLVKLICDNNQSVSEQDLYDNKWLDFESIFQKSGWKVKYDKPGYGEDYDAYFEFVKK